MNSDAKPVGVASQVATSEYTRRFLGAPGSRRREAEAPVEDTLGAYGSILGKVRAPFEEVRPIIRLLSCVFPAYNEAENIGPLLDEAVVALAPLASSYEIVVVDDGSTDETASIVRRYAETHTQVRLVSHPQNLGYGHAVRTGLSSTRGDAVIFVDGDRQFRMSDAHLLIEAFEHADLVAGRRIKRADPWHRLMIARVYKIVLNTFFGLHISDPDCAFKLFSREVIEGVVPKLESRAAFVSPELLIRSKLAGYRLVEVPVPHHPRTAGRPKGAPPKVILRTIGEIFRLRRSLQGSPSGERRGTSNVDTQ